MSNLENLQKRKDLNKCYRIVTGFEQLYYMVEKANYQVFGKLLYQ